MSTPPERATKPPRTPVMPQLIRTFPPTLGVIGGVVLSVIGVVHDELWGLYLGFCLGCISLVAWSRSDAWED